MNDQDDIRFDRQLRLDEIFSGQELARLQTDLSRLFGCTVEIVGPEAAARAGWHRRPVNWDLEPIGYVEAEKADPDQLAGAVDLLVLLVKGAVRYRMASDLHLETSLADFASLEKKHAELQKSEQQYRELSARLEQKVAAQVKAIKAAQLKIYQTEKLASVGQLAAGMAHELNTPLAYILNNLVTAQDYLRDMGAFFDSFLQGAERVDLEEAWREADIEYILKDFPDLLSSSLEGVRRSSAIISDLKTFSNINQQEYGCIDVNKQLATVVRMVSPQIDRQKIEIVLENGELPRTYGYPALLGQVFYNLILNGAQAIDGEGAVRIATSVAKDCIRVTISDTGRGIAEHEMPRIFEPFFTTKEVGSGTGLGLSVVHEALKAHNGRIKVRSTPGEGTTFTIFLPVTESSFQDPISTGDASVDHLGNA